MIRLISALLLPALALITASCTCSGGPDTPPLRPLPQLGGIPFASANPADQPIDSLLDQVMNQLIEEQATQEPVVVKELKDIEVKPTK